MTRLLAAVGVLLAVSAGGRPGFGPRMAEAAPEGTMTWGLHVTLASQWLDPAETEALITPFMILYARKTSA